MCTHDQTAGFMLIAAGPIFKYKGVRDSDQDLNFKVWHKNPGFFESQ